MNLNSAVLALVAAAILGTALSASAATVAEVSRPTATTPDLGVTQRLIVKYKTSRVPAVSADVPTRDRAMSAAGRVPMTTLRDSGNGSVVYKLASPVTKSAARAIATRLAQDPSVEYAEPDVRLHTMVDPVPNDPYATQQWNLVTPHAGVAGPLGYPGNLGSADFYTAVPLAGNARIVVAVLDTGILPHPDIVSNLLPGYDMISADADGSFTTANDGNGRDSDPLAVSCYLYGWDASKRLAESRHPSTSTSVPNPMTSHRVFTLGAAAALSMLAFAASAQQPDPQQMLQLIMQRAGLGAPAPAGARSTLPPVSEAALGNQLAAWPTAPSALNVERFRDGFAIEGERVLDPEGRIVQFSVDASTGDASYLVEGFPGQYTVKLMRHHAGPSVSIASASRQLGVWSVETTSGVKVNGSRLNLTPRGFIVARDNAVFRYVAGTGLSSFGLPEDFTLAAHQNGNVGATGWLLLEKRKDTKAREGGILSQGSLGDLVGAAKGIGSMLGVSKSDTDFALFNIETRKAIPLGISLEDDKTNVLSQCRQRNRWVAQCDQLDTVESLYGQDGSANRSHYFWRVSWYSTPHGPVAVVMEDGISKIQAIDLTTERRAVVFQRALGIGDWSTSQLPDGRVQVRAKLGFESALNEDVSLLFGEPVATK